MEREKPVIRLMDFGVARKISMRDLTEKTGSLNYIAPEVLNVDKESLYDEKSDIWGLILQRIQYLLVKCPSISTKLDL